MAMAAASCGSRTAQMSTCFCSGVCARAAAGRPTSPANAPAVASDRLRADPRGARVDRRLRKEQKSPEASRLDKDSVDQSAERVGLAGKTKATEETMGKKRSQFL